MITRKGRVSRWQEQHVFYSARREWAGQVGNKSEAKSVVRRRRAGSDQKVCAQYMYVFKYLEAYCRASLFHCFHCIFDLENAPLGTPGDDIRIILQPTNSESKRMGSESK